MPRRALFSTLFCLASLFITGCETTGLSPQQAAAVEARHRQIALEPRGDYYIGRRFYINHTHLWGYVRSPGQTWENSRLVIMNERYQKIPYRLPEQPGDGGYAYGDDHNAEYTLWGRFTGRKVFDPATSSSPNSNCAAGNPAMKTPAGSSSPTKNSTVPSSCVQNQEQRPKA